MATITIELEEYKELLRQSVQMEYETKIHDMEAKVAKAEEMKCYWYDRWATVQKELDTLKAEKEVG